MGVLFMSNENESTAFEPNENNNNEVQETNEVQESEKTAETTETAEAPAEQAEEAAVNTEEKPVLPRKRKIVKNNQLLVSACITGAVLLILLVWKLFFDQGVLGQWHYEVELPLETSDTADMAAAENAETSDQATAVRSIVYDFQKNGTCKVTYGTMSVIGTYQVASTEDMGNIISANVYYGYSPVFYGTYKYTVKGNIFTGKTLVLENAYYDDDVQTFEKGKAKELLTPYADKKLDERLTGKWYDSENDITFEFTNDGEMYRSSSDGMTVRHLYTIMQDNIIMTKYFNETEETYTYGYEFQGDDLYIDGFVMKKLDR